jgi:hypothetical protein
MIVVQANPGFELPPQERTGYEDLLGILEEEIVAFGKPVALLHGDTHTFRADKPMTSSRTGERVENFTRVETFGSPTVSWSALGSSRRRVVRLRYPTGSARGGREMFCRQMIQHEVECELLPFVQASMPLQQTRYISPY